MAWLAIGKPMGTRTVSGYNAAVSGGVEEAMMASTNPVLERLRPSTQTSTRIAFFIAGFGMAAWAPLVPFVKSRAALTDGTLGLLLLCLGAGSIVAMPLAGFLCGRIGCRSVVITATLLVCATLPVLAVASSAPWLVATLLLFGAAIGSLDCAMNIQAVMVERRSGRALMSGFHGLFSVGGIAAAAGMSGLLVAGATPLVAVLGVVLVVAALLAVAAPHLISKGANADSSSFAIPRGVVLFIGALCFISFLTEGAALDWSAVFLTSERGMSASNAGWGYAVFSAAMTVGRLTGDRIVSQ
ncbi:MFS transporter, partial [Acidisphaera sp. L21]|uniref:MFS transporter n=1 Tax=Acidisphaera sp. L21 TaxID=1641851 RepID=UPI001C204D72